MAKAERKRIPLTVLLAVVLMLTAGAAEAEWHLRFEPMSMEPSGHDPEVLTIREGSGARQVSLESESGAAWRGEYRHRRGERWGWGVDFFWFNTAQKGSATATGSAESPVRFEIADGVGYTSSGPGEVLFFDRLEDTDMAMWTADLYATRKLGERLILVLGVRSADFDNDRRAVVGITDVAGTRIDASSNYGRMTGPLVGIEASIERGKNRFDAYLGQSVVFGDAELQSRQRDFLGTFSADPDPPFISDRQFRRNESATIPITDLRLRWTYRLGGHFGLGVGANSSIWSSVPVPPGANPGGTLATRDEATLTLLGAFVALEVSF